MRNFGTPPLFLALIGEFVLPVRTVGADSIGCGDVRAITGEKA